MSRVAVVLLIVGIVTDSRGYRPPAAWPLRATVTDVRGRSVAFRALTLGGDLIFTRSPVRPIPQPLAYGDTLAAITPASFPLDLKRGAVVFFTTSNDNLRVVVGRNPFGAVNPASATGRRLTVRMLNDSIIIDAR